MFVGRQDELKLLRRCAERAARDGSTTVWLTGPAGVGKTSLLQRFVADLDIVHLLGSAGGRSRRAEAYQVLNELLAGYRDVRVPAGTDVVPAAAELLDLIGELQTDAPVVLVVDDVHRVDRHSLRALDFARHRLGRERVLIVLSGREGEPPAPADEGTWITLGGLTGSEVAEFVAAHGGGAVGPGAARWMRARTGGHPTLLRALLISGGDPDPGPASAPDVAFLAWLDARSEPARALLDALAVLDTTVPLVRLAQLAGVTDPAAALESARADGVVEWAPFDPSSPVGFARPEQRDAVYAALSAGRRRTLHRAAAELAGRREAWSHRVAAAAGPDDSLAGELERAAADEQAGGDSEAAATFALWAAGLSAARADHERRLLTACLYSMRDFRTVWAARRIAEIDDCAESPLRDCVRGVLAMLRDNYLVEAERLLGRAVRADLAPDQEWVRRAAAVYLAGVHMWQGRGQEMVHVAELALVDGVTDPRTADLARFLRSMGHSREAGWSVSLAALDHLPDRAERATRFDVECLALRGALRAMGGELLAAREDLAMVVRLRRAGTRSAFGTGSFYYLAAVHYLLGDWDDSALIASEGLAAAEADQQVYYRGLARLAAVLVPAGRGEVAEAERQVRGARQGAERFGTPQDRRYAAIAGAVHAQARDDHGAMLEALTPVRGLAADQARAEHQWWRLWWQPLLVEALIGTGNLAEAGRELDALIDEAARVPYLRLSLARLRGWLLDRQGNVEAARMTYQSALAAPPDAEDPPQHRAMLEVSLGKLLQAQGVATAAGCLETAHRRFGALGAAPFADRCTRLLTRRPDPLGDVARGRLSDRENQVVRLVQGGLTNREIAAELYLSSKTVEYHLGNIFAKLGISGRRQLRHLD